MHILRGMLGLAVLLFIAWLLSSNRRRFPWKIVLGGIVLQWALALAILKTQIGGRIFGILALLVTTVLDGAAQGAAFLCKPFAPDDGPPWWANVGITIVSTIIVVATLSAVGYHYGILQKCVAAMAWVMKRAMGVSGAESLAAAANVFFGQTEAPLLVRPYIAKMTRSELMALMTGGFATVAAGVLAVYVQYLGGDDPAKSVDVARHLITACLMSAPAAFVTAKIMVPETEEAATSGHVRVALPRETNSLVDALTRGASQGMTLAINVLAMLIAFIALIAILDAGLGALGRWQPVSSQLPRIGLGTLNTDGLLGIAFSPVAWLIGVPADDCRTFGGLLGKAMATNELIAYESLSSIMRSDAMSQRSIVMAIYSLCGFANFSSIGIQIGGIGVLAPERRDDLVKLGPRAMLGGAMACWMTGCIAGMLVA